MLQNKWIQTIVIFLLISFIWGLTTLDIRLIDAVNLAEFFGENLGFLLIGLIISNLLAAIVRLKGGKWPRWQVWGSLPFIAILMVLNLIASKDTSANQHSAIIQALGGEYRFSDDLCELTVQFPGTPSFRMNHGPGGMQMREARYNTESGFHLRAECSDYDGIWDGLTRFARDEDWTDWMFRFMTTEGLSNIQISTTDSEHLSDQVRVVDGRGYKTVSDVDATFRIRLLAAEKSIMILYAIGPSSKFPSREVGAFLESYR